MAYRNEHRKCRDFQKDHPCAVHRHVRYHYATALVTSLCAFLLLYGSALTSAAADEPPITIYAAGWCGPCRELKAALKLKNPTITEGISRLRDGTPVRLIDYDKLPQSSRPNEIPAVSLRGERAKNLGKPDTTAKKIFAEAQRRRSENNAGENRSHNEAIKLPNMTPTATPTPTGTPEVCPVCHGEGHTCQGDVCTPCELCGGDGKLGHDPAPDQPDGSTPGGSGDDSSPGGDSGGEDPGGEEEDLGDDGGGGGGSGGGGSGGGGQDDMMKNMMLQELMKNNQQQQQRRQEQEQQRQQEELQRQQEQRRKEEELRRLQQQDPEAENQERQQNNSGENTQKVAPQASPKPTPDPASVAEQQRNKELFPTLSLF